MKCIFFSLTDCKIFCLYFVFCSFSMIWVSILHCIILFSFAGGVFILLSVFWAIGLVFWYCHQFWKFLAIQFSNISSAYSPFLFPLGFHWHVCQTIWYHSTALRCPVFFLLFFSVFQFGLVSIDLPSSFLIFFLSYVESTDQSISWNSHISYYVVDF